MEEKPNSSLRDGLASFCEHTCPVCTRARKNPGGAAFWFVKSIDRKVCPMCKAYESKHGKPAYE